MDDARRSLSRHALQDGMFEALPLTLAEFDAELRCIRINRACADLLDVRPATLQGRLVCDFPPPFPEHALPLLVAARSETPIRDREVFDYFPGQPGVGAHLLLRAHANRRPDGHVVSLMLIITDVSDRRPAPPASQESYCELIEKALAEKSTLLNEIHYRAKYNLQIICSLLSLQARSAGAEVAAALAESQRRVKAIALIHQLLYEHRDFSRVDLAEYLRRLCRQIAESFTSTRDRIEVAFRSGDGGMSLDIQRAVPCGLLVNELVTNAVLHAFPNGRHGTVTVTAARKEQGAYQISVLDDGIAVAPDMQPHCSLNFQLIPLLADHAGGELRLDRKGGTRFDLVLSKVG